MSNNSMQSRAEATRQGESVDPTFSYTMPQRFNGMTEPETWRLERAYVRTQLLNQNTVAVALKKALDALSTPEARTLKLKLCFTDPELE